MFLIVTNKTETLRMINNFLEISPKKPSLKFSVDDTDELLL